MMRAIVIDKSGEPGTLREVPALHAEPGNVLVRVSVAGVNPVDWKIRDGAYGEPGHVPLTLGQDFAGTIEAVGTGVNAFAPGDRAFGIARESGSYAEFATVPADSHESPIGMTPAHVSDEVAAALPTPGLTALAAIEMLHVAKDTKLLITGAAGAVGGLAVQLAHQRGAYVIGTVKGDGDALQGLDADVVIDTDGSDPIAEVKQQFARGIDAVLDLVSTDAASAMRYVGLLRQGGAIVSTRHALDVDAITKQGYEATNLLMNETPQSSRAGLEHLADMVASGELVVRIGQEEPLADASRVLNETKSAHISGKTVLRVNGTRG
jgi:NADPH:quinone reductase-like Zn-dependent oxidoreductase